MNYLDLFSGIGGFHLGLLKAGFKFDWVGFSEIDKYAKQIYQKHFPESEDLGDVRTIEINKLPRINLITFGFPCFPSNMQVLTKLGYRAIIDIKEGDLIYTHEGRYKQCIQRMHKIYKGNMYKFLLPNGNKPLTCTEEHPIFVSTKTKKWNNKIRKYDITFSENYFKKAYNIDKNDYFLIPIPKGDKKIYTKEEMAFFGFYLAEGWYSKRKKKNRHQDYRIYLAINELEIPYVEQLINNIVVKSRFSTLKKYKIHYEKTEGKGIKAIISSKYLWEAVQQFGENAKNKTIPYSFLDISKELLKVFIEAYFKGDGYYNKKGFFSVTTVSPYIPEILRLLILKTYNQLPSIFLDKNNSLFSTINNRVVKRNNYYSIRFYPNGRKKYNYWFIKNNYLYIRLKEIHKYETTELVYNIGIAEDESYTVGITSVHNCQDLSIAGKRGGITASRSGLFFEAMQIIRATRPNYFIFENVKGLFSSNEGRDWVTILREVANSGYDGQWQLLNTRWFLPQNRERIYFVGHIRGKCRPKIFPITERDFISHIKQNGVYREYINTLTKSYGKISGCSSKIFVNGLIRINTPVELERLQGFKDNWTLKVSDTQRYKCLGNAVTVPIVKLIAERLKKYV